MSDGSQDKQLPATPKRLEKARKEGQIPRSRDLGHLAVVAAALGVIAATIGPVTERLRDLMAAALRFDVVTLKSPERMLERLHDMGLSVLPIVLIFGLVTALAALAAAVAGVGASRSARYLSSAVCASLLRFSSTRSAPSISHGCAALGSARVAAASCASAVS